MNAKTFLPALALVTLAACTESERSSLGEVGNAVAVVPRTSCDGLGLGDHSFPLYAPTSGDHELDANNHLHFQYYDDSHTTFYFNESTIRMTAVLVSSGEHTMVWDIGAPGADGWGSLHGPPDAETGELPTPDEVQFCYDFQLYVHASPYASYRNRNMWILAAGGTGGPVTLDPGEARLLEHDVTLHHIGSRPDGQFIEGPLHLHNQSIGYAIVGPLTVDVGDTAATVTCPTELPIWIAPGATVVCELRAEVYDDSDRTVVVHAGGYPPVRTQEAIASFSSPTTGTFEADNCVKVTSTAAPYQDHFLGVVCAEDGTETFAFSSEVGPFTACGDVSVTTTASYEGLDSGETRSDDHTIPITVPCP